MELVLIHFVPRLFSAKRDNGEAPYVPLGPCGTIHTSNNREYDYELLKHTRMWICNLSGPSANLWVLVSHWSEGP